MSLRRMFFAGLALPAVVAPPPPVIRYTPPYPTNQLLAYYDTKFGRELAVTESNGLVTGFRNQVSGTGIGDLVARGTWQPNGQVMLQQAATLAFPAGLATPYTIFFLTKIDLHSSAYQGSGGFTFLSGATPSGTDSALALFTGYGGANYILKGFAGNGYRETSSSLLNTPSGQAYNVLGVSTQADGNAILLADTIAEYVVNAGTRTLGSFYAMDAQFPLSALLVYSRPFSIPEMQEVYNMMRQEYSF